MATRSRTLDDKPIVTTTGQRAGAVRDVLINDQTGGIDALDVTAPDGGGLLTRRSRSRYQVRSQSEETSW